MQQFKNVLDTIKIQKQALDKTNKVITRKRGRPSLPNKRYYHIRLDVQLHQRVRAWALENHMTKSDAIAQALVQFLKKSI